MRATRLIRKLIRDPAAFSSDSNKKVIRLVGSLALGPNVVGKPRHAPKPTPRVSDVVGLKPTPSPTKRKNTKRKQINYRTPLAFLPDSKLFATHPMTWYQEYNSVSSPDSTAILFPSGNCLWDAALAETLKISGISVRFFPTWTLATSPLSVDGLEFRLRKNPASVPSLINRLMRSVSDATRLIVFPHDCTLLTRGLALATRQRGIGTACWVYPHINGLGMYGEDTQLRPVCEYVVVGAWPELDPLALHLSKSRKVLRLDMEASSNSRRHEPGAETDQPKPALILTPPVQLSSSDNDICECMDALICPSMAPLEVRSHLNIVIRGDKLGYLNNEHRLALSSHYTKSVLTHGDGTNLLEKCRSSSSIAAADLATFLVARSISPNATATFFGKQPASESFESFTTLHSFSELLTARGRQQSVSSTFLEDLKLLAQIHDDQEQVFDIVAVPDPTSNVAITHGRQRYLSSLLNCRERVYGAGTIQEAGLADIFLQWGAEPSESKRRPELFRSAFARKKLWVEDGFVRSMGLWVDPNEPTLSVIMDTNAVYYDATRESLMEKILNSDWSISESERTRARTLIDRIVSERISKYNYAPVSNLGGATREKRKVLLIDQKAGDMSIKYGLANSQSFSNMIDLAAEQIENTEFIVKQHPCAISGGSEHAHYTATSIREFASHKNVNLISFDINPYSLIDAVDEVWCVSSGMGFEALLAGKRVRCFGVPFFSNWGLTDDQLNLPRRKKLRSLEEIFHVAYLWLSRYYDPRSNSVCQLEQLLDYVSEMRGNPGSELCN